MLDDCSGYPFTISTPSGPKNTDQRDSTRASEGHVCAHNGIVFIGIFKRRTFAHISDRLLVPELQIKERILQICEKLANRLSL